MTRPQPVRFGRSAPTMAYQEGRLLAVRDGRTYVLATDGWTRVGDSGPSGATWLVRAEVERWCQQVGVDPTVLDEVPAE